MKDCISKTDGQLFADSKEFSLLGTVACQDEVLQEDCDISSVHMLVTRTTQSPFTDMKQKLKVPVHEH